MGETTSWAASDLRFLEEQQGERQTVSGFVSMPGKEAGRELAHGVKRSEMLIPRSQCGYIFKCTRTTRSVEQCHQDGSCQLSCAICLLEVVPDDMVPGPESEVQQGHASSQGVTAHAHPPWVSHLSQNTWQHRPGTLVYML